MGTKRSRIIFTALIFGLCAALVPFAVGYTPDCSEPPFIKAGAKSNILFILDNSGSMNEFAFEEATVQVRSAPPPPPSTVTLTWSDRLCATPGGPCSTIGQACTGSQDCSGWPYNRSWTGDTHCGSCPSGTTCDSTDCNGAPSTNAGAQTCYQKMCWTAGEAWVDNGAGPPPSWQPGYCERSFWCRRVCTNKGKCQSGSGSCQLRLFNGSYPTCRMADGSSMPGDVSYTCTDPASCTLSYAPSASGSISATAYTGYDPARTYYGIFNSDKAYKYSNVAGEHFFYTQDDWNAVEFVPAGKTYTVRAACTTTGTCDKFSGNWLNWLTMRRIDLAKKVLTGGRLGGDTANWVLVGGPLDLSYGDWKAFNDNGTDGVFYTPFGNTSGKPLAIYFSTQDPGGGRTPSATTLTGKRWPQGRFVPLFSIFPATISSGTYLVTDTALSLDGTYGNAGETLGGREYAGSYYLAVKYAAVASGAAADTPPTGVVQNFADKVRFGYMHFNYGQGPADGYSLSANVITRDFDGDGTVDLREGRGDGGRIINYMGDISKVNLTQTRSLSPTLIQGYDVVFNINETPPLMYTPLAETLREVMNYLKQDDPCYAWVDGSGVKQQNFIKDTAHDPFAGVELCMRTYIILVSDGGATNDSPCKCGCNTLGSSACSSNDCAPITRTFRFNGTGYMDDIAYIMHTEDLRPELGGTCTIVPNTAGTCGAQTDPPYKVAPDYPDTCQTASLYSIFVFETDAAAQDAMARAGMAGGFTDYNKDNQPGCVGSGVTDWRCAYPSPSYSGCGTSHAPAGWTGYTEWDPSGAKQPDHFFWASQDTIGASLEGFLSSIFTSIALSGSGGAVATISQETAEGDVIVRGAFEAADPTDKSRYLWYGHLEAYWPDSSGLYQFDGTMPAIPFCEFVIADGNCVSASTDCPGCPEGKRCWDAGKKLQLRSTARTVYTMIDGVQKEFNLTTAADATYAAPLRALMRNTTTGDFPDSDMERALIQYTRGAMDTSGNYPVDDSGNTITSAGVFRNRHGHKLGDIVYSTPVIVGPPSLGGVSGVDPDVVDFWAYRYDQRERQKVAYVGANDGMIHAIRLARRQTDADTGVTTWCYNCDDCGDEIWAYIPSNFLGDLQALASVDYGYGNCKHRTMVDLSPRAWDVRLTRRTTFTNADGTTSQTEGCSTDAGCTTGECWRTVIVGGERGGGDAYFAIDVTDPENPVILWEYSVLKNLAVVYNTSAPRKIALPFKSHNVNGDCSFDDDDVYFKLKTMPMTWSEPAIGRMKFPRDAGFWLYAADDLSAAKELAPSQMTWSSGTDCSVPDANVRAKLKKKTFTACDNKRHMVFIGGGFRLFEPTLTKLGTTPVPNDEDGGDRVVKALTRPNFMAIDLDTGLNYFQVIWPITNYARHAASTDRLPDKYMPSSSTTNLIPWAMAGPTAVDVWDNELDGVGEDGFVDTIYVGDLRGYLTRIRFQLKEVLTGDPPVPDTSFPNGINVNFRLTKAIPDPDTPTDPATCDQTDAFRDCRQPITVPPAVAWDASTVGSSTPSLRVVFGTGKFDDVRGTLGHDKSDLAQMSFYNRKDLVAGKDPGTGTGWYYVKDPITGDAMVTSPGSATVTPATGLITYDSVSGFASDLSNGFLVADTNFVVNYGDGECTPDQYTNWACTSARSDCCNWSQTCNPSTTTCEFCRPDAATKCTNSDCCEESCSASCWTCIYDFATPGERVIGKALISQGLVYFTTFAPQDTGCVGGGNGFLYVLNYQCRPFKDNIPPIVATATRAVQNLTTGADPPQIFGVKMDLGAGMPSRPVLDSKGENVIVQKSDATLSITHTDPGGTGRVMFQGWSTGTGR